MICSLLKVWTTLEVGKIYFILNKAQDTFNLRVVGFSWIPRVNESTHVYASYQTPGFAVGPSQPYPLPCRMPILPLTFHLAKDGIIQPELNTAYHRCRKWRNRESHRDETPTEEASRRPMRIS